MIGRLAENQTYKMQTPKSAPTRSLNSSNQTNNLTFDDDHTALPLIVQIQRRLLTFFYIYATLIVTLYLTYAIYCYYQHTTSSSTAAAAAAGQQQLKQQQGSSMQQALLVDSERQQQQDLEQKLHLLERYIEMIALDLEETKGRLREREKCACSLKCSFNGTIFQDGQIWQQKCDTCTCSGGKISCLPRKCPQTNCENPVQLAGQCCPSCMKSCKLNKSIIKHGEPIKLRETKPTKQCKCNNGLIKCETIQNQTKVAQNNHAQNRTMEYLKTIIASPQLVKLKAS